VGKQICDACILSWKALTAVNVADAAAGGYCEEGMQMEVRIDSDCASLQLTKNPKGVKQCQV
jgi:hypothetical protein